MAPLYLLGRRMQNLRGSLVLLLLGPSVQDPLAQQGAPQAGFLRLIDRPRVPLAPVVTELPGSRQEHFTFMSEAGERVPVDAALPCP